MRTEYRFSNLLGTVYLKGRLTFTPDGTCLLSPVGNRVTVFDLVNNKSYTLPFAHRRNISHLALNSRANLLLTIDEDGRAILSNFPRRLALYHFSFQGPVSALAFSPSGEYFVVGRGRMVEVWRTPTAPGTDASEVLEFAPFVRHHVHAGHSDVVQSIAWSGDSRFFLTSSKDLTARIWSLETEERSVATTLGGHREAVIAAWFSGDQESIYSVSVDGALFEWKYVPKQQPQNGDLDAMDDSEDGSSSASRWRIVSRHYFQQNNAKVKCAAYHASSNMIVAGFSNGLFGLYEMPDFNKIHILSISHSGIDEVTINNTGEWLAFGASKLGQLLVWEWQSESYILKQQGHFDSMNSLVYSPDGQRVVTAAEDGKLKVWDIRSGFCVVTFTEHSSAVTDCAFARKGNVLFTSSLDGSVRAWDLIRYRNFRSFTAPERLSFSSVAIDPSGEVVCAGSTDSFDIHIWSVQTGQLLDRLSGHEGPVSSIAFAATDGVLVSGSWDHTVRIWSVFGRTQTSEPLQLQSDVLNVAVRPDSKQIAVSTLDGQLSFWSIEDATQLAGLDGRRDISGGRRISDRRTAVNASGSKSFNCLAYSTDGQCLIAGGNSKYMCLYDVLSGTLLKKYTVSINLSLDGTQEYLNSRNLTEAGPAGLIDRQGEFSDLEDRIDRTMPGATRSDMAARRTRPEVRVTAIAFSPTGSTFCAASTEGLLMYSLDSQVQFDPFDLSMDVTPDTTLAVLRDDKDYVRALAMAFRINEFALLRTVYNHVPASDITLVVKALPLVYLPRLLRFVTKSADESPRLEFNLSWIQAILVAHGRHLKDSAGQMGPEIRAVQKSVARVQRELIRLSQENIFALKYLLEKPVEQSRHPMRNGNFDALENGVSKPETNGTGNEKVLTIEPPPMDTPTEEWIGLSESD